MAKSIYLEKAMLSDELMLAVEVSGYKQQWDEIIRYLSETYVDFSQEWKYYGKAWGWTLMLKSKSKTLCYITPAQEYFQVSVIFNDKGRALAAAYDLPETVLQAVEASKGNPKNIPYDFDIRTNTDTDIAKRLIEIRSKT